MGQKRTQGMIDPITGRISIKLMCLYSILVVMNLVIILMTDVVRTGSRE